MRVPERVASQWRRMPPAVKTTVELEEKGQLTGMRERTQCWFKQGAEMGAPQVSYSKRVH